MEQFVFFPASVYNTKSLNNQAVWKQELPKCQAEQNPTYQFDSLKMEINKKLSGKADSNWQNYSGSRIKLWNLQTLNMDVMKTRFLLWELAQHIRCENTDVPDIYFTYLMRLVISPIWFWIKMLKSKREEAGSLWIYERQKFEKLYMQGGAACGSVRNLVETSTSMKGGTIFNFLYTKFTLFTRKNKRIRAFVGFNDKIWFMDPAFVDKLAKDNTGVKYLLNRQDLFDRTVDANGTETKDSEKTVSAFLTMVTENNWPKKFAMATQRKLLENLKKYAKLKECNFTLQYMRLRLHLLNVQYDPWKLNLTIIWKIMLSSTFTRWLISSQPWVLERIAW